MSENRNETPTVTGTPAPPAAAPAAIPSNRRTFRRTNNANFGSTVSMPVPYTKETGIPPIVGATEGYRFHENTDHTPSTYVPSFLTLVATWYLSCQRFSGHDRFLKDTSSWHPYYDLLYLSFLMMYHILRVRRRFGFFDTGEQQLLSDLEALYPPSSLHIPGQYVHIFQSITAVESPYPWQGLIGATIPHEMMYLRARDCFLPRHCMHYIFTHPLIAFSLLDEIVRTMRTDANASVAPGFLSYFGQPIDISFPQLDVLNSTYARVGNPCSPRAEHLFWTNFSGTNGNESAANFYRTWDLPRRPSLPSTNGAFLSLPQIMCIVDCPSVPNPSPRFRNWPNQYSSVMALQCQYVKGSRTLNDISESGLGACIPVWLYANQTFNLADPSSFTKGPTENPEFDFVSCRNAKIISSLAANATSRDPEGDQLSTQYSAISQVNVDFSGQSILPAPNHLRSGPFWDTPVCELGPLYDPARLLATAVNGAILSTKI